MDMTWLYWIDALTKISAISAVGLAVFGFSTLVACAWWSDGSLRTLLAPITCGFLTLLCLGGFILIPSQKTMYAMAIGSQLTPEVLEMGSEMITDTVDYTVEKINELIRGK